MQIKKNVLTDKWQLNDDCRFDFAKISHDGEKKGFTTNSQKHEIYNNHNFSVL